MLWTGKEACVDVCAPVAEPLLDQINFDQRHAEIPSPILCTLKVLEDFYAGRHETYESNASENQASGFSHVVWLVWVRKGEQDERSAVEDVFHQ